MVARRIATVIATALLSATVVGASPALADDEVVQTPAEAQATDQKAIAEARGWTVAQTRAHIEASDEARRIGREIRKKRPDIFIGAALSEKPLGAPSVYVKGPAPKFVKELIATADYPMKLVDDQPYSRDELHARADKVFESLLDAGYRQVTADVDITGAGMIPVAVLETPGLSSKRADILADVPSGLRDSVELTVSTKPFGEGDHARGGPAVYPHAYPTRFCTAGFSVEHKSNGKKGVVSAGHCGYVPPGGTYKKVDRMHNSNPHTLWKQAEHRGQWGDFEWYTTNATEQPKFRATSSLVRDVLWRRKFDDIQVGDPNCVYGKASGDSNCTAKVKYVARKCCCTDTGGNYKNMVIVNKDVGIGGDSGGPWYRYNTAVGIHHGSCALQGGTDSFSAIDLLDEAMNVEVMKK